MHKQYPCQVSDPTRDLVSWLRERTHVNQHCLSLLSPHKQRCLHSCEYHCSQPGTRNLWSFQNQCLGTMVTCFSHRLLLEPLYQDPLVQLGQRFGEN